MQPKNNEEAVYQAVVNGELEIDNLGQIWRIACRRADRWNGGTKIIPCKRRRAENDMGDYFQIRVMFDGKRHIALAHRLVWRHFKGPIPTGLTINHKDGQKKRNVPDNLELATYSEQQIHATQALKVGHACNQHGSKNSMAKLSEIQAIEIKRRRKTGESLKSIAKDYGISDRAVSKIALGQRWVSLG